MTQSEKRILLIQALLKERGEEVSLIPEDTNLQKQLLRSLMNVRPPGSISPEILKIQDEYLQEVNKERGITDLCNLSPVKGTEKIYLWKGDITTLKVDAIVNAANSGLTGCYSPCHNCIDNCIHTYAGMALRNYCAQIIKEQGHEESTGLAKITPAFNLPCKYVLHTVGPIIYSDVSEKDENFLKSCYENCLKLAVQNNCKSIAFCCISTGVFRFPQKMAAKIAVNTVRKFLEKTQSPIKVVFNVFSNIDYKIYEAVLK